MTGSGSDYIVADSTLDRISFGCFSTIRCMISFVILSITAAAVVPVLGFVTAPFGRPVVTQSLAFDCVTSITGLRSGAGCIFPVMTESRSGAGCIFPVMTESRSYYAPMIDDFCKSVSILKDLTTLTLVVYLVTGVNAVGRLCFHLGQMGSADMTGSGSDSNGCRDTSRIFGLVVLVVGYQINQCDFVILCSCVVVNGTLEFHQCQFIGSGIRNCAKTVQKTRLGRIKCPRCPRNTFKCLSPI